MLNFGLPRAENCLRCRLQQALQHASRSGYHFQGGVLRHDLQRRHESTEVELPPQDDKQQTFRIRRDFNDSGDVQYRIIAPRGKMRRIRGSTQREDRKQLGIKSLGQESEVIVLRDVPDQPKLHKSERVISFRGTADTAHSMTAEEIEALFRQQKPAKRDEIEQAIAELKPQEEILSRQEFDKGLKALTKGFSKSQLKGYLNRNTPKHLLHAQSPKQDVRTVDTGDIRYLESSAWFGGVTDINKPLSGEARSSKSATETTAPKQNLAMSIHRLVWNVRVEEEATTQGELDLLLTPAQWGLLHTRDATDLFSMMRSRKFYQNSRFERSGKRGVIRVIGPKAEAEDIANVFQSAFERASTQTVDLNAFQHRPSHAESQDLSGIFTPTQLQAIMNLSKTFVMFDPATNKVNAVFNETRYPKLIPMQLSIHGFSQDHIESALRLLMALLTLPLPRVTKTFVGDHKDIGLAPAFVGKTLPSRIRASKVGRWTSSVVNISSNSDEKPSQSGTILPPPLFENLTKHMEHKDHLSELPVPEEVEGSYWTTQIVSPPWKATLGYVLHPLTVAESANYLNTQSEGLIDPTSTPALSSSQLPTLETKKASIFTPQAPGLNKALSLFQFALYRRMARNKSLPSQLTVRLIPSPFSATDASKRNVLPPISILLSIDTNKSENQIAERPATKSRNQWSFPIDETTAVKVIGINAELTETHYYLALPNYSIDLRFSKHWSVAAAQIEAFKDPELRAFITTVIESIRSGTELKAPQTVDIKLPSWMTKDTKSEQQVTKHSYFFAGFEHRGRRRFSPSKKMGKVAPDLSDKFVLSVNAIEGGFSGGRQVEVAIMPTPNYGVANNNSRPQVSEAASTEGADDAKALVKAAEAMVQLLESSQSGALAPVLRRGEGPPPSSQTVERHVSVSRQD